MNIIPWPILRSLMVFTIFFMPIFSYAVELVDMPLRLVNEDGTDVDWYCVAPLYAKSWGIGWGVEEQGRSHGSERYLKWPIILKKNDRSRDKIKEKRSWFFPVVVFGESIFPNRLLFLKKGYAPLLWDSYIDDTKQRLVVFHIGDSSLAIDALVSGMTDQQALRALYGLKNPDRIIAEYTDEDRNLLSQCR
jgi:hypothetical protein